MKRISPAVLLFAVGFLLRFAGAWHGLPNAITPDEPHHINVAVYFGTGDFNPHVFKYPTLWMYTLAAAYGIAFLAWSGLGLLRSASDFAVLFVTDPTLFFTIGRALAAAFGAATAIFVMKMGRRLFGPAAGLAAGVLCAVSPPLVDYSHVAKADMEMVFFVSVGWWFCVRYFQSGLMREALAAGAAFGLGISAQYIGVLILPLIAWAHFLREEPFSRRVRTAYRPAAAYAIALAAFVIGSPYLLLDFQTASRDLRDLQAFGLGDLTFERERLGWTIVSHYLRAAGPALWGGVLFVAGTMVAWRKSRRTLLLLAAPLIWCGIYLGTRDVSAGPINYTFASALGELVVMGLAVELIPLRRRGLAIGLVALLPFALSVHATLGWFTPDTRTAAQAWIEANVPAGSRLLVDQNHTMPRLLMSRTQAERLLARSVESNHPRRYYFEAILKKHPGGGYELIRLSRTAVELVTIRRLTRWSKEGYEELDVEPGMEALLENGIDYIIRSDWGARPDNSPRLGRYFTELEAEGELLKEFVPRHHRYAPRIRIYRLNDR